VIFFFFDSRVERDVLISAERPGTAITRSSSSLYRLNTSCWDTPVDSFPLKIDVVHRSRETDITISLMETLLAVCNDRHGGLNDRDGGRRF